MDKAVLMSLPGRLGELDARFEKLKNNLSFGRLGKIFNTDEAYYFYDTGTGKVATITEDMFLVLNSLFKNESLSYLLDNSFDEEQLIQVAEEILHYIATERILSAKVPVTFVNNGTEGLEALLRRMDLC